MKLSELVARFPHLKLVRDGTFLSFGFCENKRTPGLLIYLNREDYVKNAKNNVNVSSVLTTPAIAEHLHTSNKYGLVTTEDPAKDFVEIHNYCVRNGLLYQTAEFETEIGDCCAISTQAHIAGKNVKIGRGTVIEPGAIIMENVIIGDDCVIGANTVVGSRGFQFCKSGNDRIYMEHTGGVIIGNRVEILSGVTIASGLIEPTQIHDRVKIDNQVHIAHSDIIEESTMIAAGVKIGGSAHIGKSVWIGLNATICSLVDIGDEAYICMGAVVPNKIKSAEKVSGNFAENHIERILREKKVQRFFRRDKTQ